MMCSKKSSKIYNTDFGNKIFILLFFAIILVVTFTHIIKKDTLFSQLENRYLTKFPEVSLKSISSGEFTDSFESYFQDQFPWRNSWIGIKSDLERAQLKIDNNGIYFGSNGYLFEKFTQPGKFFEPNLNSINKFRESLNSHIPLNFMLVPNSQDIYTEYLPKNAWVYNQMELFRKAKKTLSSKINFVYPYEDIKNNKESYLYFKTDHHWTMLGAYYGYKSYLESKNVIPPSVTSFDFSMLSSDFYGTYHARSGRFKISPDIIYAADESYFGDVTVSFNTSDKVHNTMYFKDNLLKKDKYTVFLNGNNPLVTITTTSESKKNLLVIKDSYAHAMLPFLTLDYSKIHVVDPRYYKKDLFNYIEENSIHEVLVLYNMSNFTEDSSLNWINYHS